VHGLPHIQRGNQSFLYGTVAGRFLTQQVMPAKNEIAGLFETKEVGFELRDHVGFRYDIFEKNVASNVGKTWSPENGYQFTILVGRAIELRKTDVSGRRHLSGREEGNTTTTLIASGLFGPA
jgi:hypothetical protein